MVAADRSTAVVIVVVDGDDGEMAVWRVDGTRPPDLLDVDILARLQLEAGRQGWSVRVHDPCGQLRRLLELAGLGAVVPDAGGSLRRGEPVGEAEGGEQRGVEEVVEARDPPV